MSTEAQPQSAAAAWKRATDDPTALIAERDRLLEIVRKVDVLMANQFGVVATHIRGLIKPVLLLLLCFTLSGCAKPIRAIEKPIPEPQPDVVDNRDIGDQHSDEEALPSPDPQGVAVQVSIPPNAWEWLAKNVVCQTITLEDEIRVDGVTVPAGSHLKIEVEQDHALVTFSKPYPNARRGIVNADIKAVTLKPDGSGLAQTAKFGSWGFRWLDDGVKAGDSHGCACGCSTPNCQCGLQNTMESARAPMGIKTGQNGSNSANLSGNTVRSHGDQKPTVTAYLPDWCAACGTIKAALLRDGKPRTDLPFEVVLKTSNEELAADGVQSVPLVRWRSTQGTWLFFDNTNWSSLDHLVNSWRANHQEWK